MFSIVSVIMFKGNPCNHSSLVFTVNPHPSRYGNSLYMDYHWRSVQTCSLQDSLPCMFGWRKQAVRILLECFLVANWLSTVTNPGFPRREGTNPKSECAKLLYWPFFWKNCIKLKKNWTKGEALGKCLGSANSLTDNNIYNMFFIICHLRLFKLILRQMSNNFISKGSCTCREWLYQEICRIYSY